MKISHNYTYITSLWTSSPLPTSIPICREGMEIQIQSPGLWTQQRKNIYINLKILVRNPMSNDQWSSHRERCPQTQKTRVLDQVPYFPGLGSDTPSIVLRFSLWSRGNVLQDLTPAWNLAPILERATRAILQVCISSLPLSRGTVPLLAYLQQ